MQMRLALILPGGLLLYGCAWPRKGFEGGQQQDSAERREQPGIFTTLAG